jgi:protein gp37
MHPDWARSIRDQCQDAGVSFFFKQWGEFHPATPDDPPGAGVLVDGRKECGYYCDESVGHVDHRAHAMIHVGKRAAGRQLDGRTWDEFPR